MPSALGHHPNTVATQFTSETATLAIAKRKRHRLKKDLTQIVEMQEVLWKMVTSPAIAPKDASACARAWSELRNRKRELLNVPVPKPIDVQPRKSKRSGPTFQEP